MNFTPVTTKHHLLFFFAFSMSLKLGDKGAAVPNVDHDSLHARVLGKLLVQFSQGGSICTLVFVSDHKPSPEHVVDCNDASLSQQGQTQLIVVVVVLLVGIDEGKIECSSLVVVDQLLKSLSCWSDL